MKQDRHKSLGWQLFELARSQRITVEEIEQRAKRSRVVIGYQCQRADCDCHLMAGTSNVPPFHKGCDCVMEVSE